MAKEHPIIFNSEMVRGILDGRKTQTRRPVKEQCFNSQTGESVHKFIEWYEKDAEAVASGIGGFHWAAKCPFGVPGDTMWVRETWAVDRKWWDTPPRNIPPGEVVYYHANNVDSIDWMSEYRGHWRPSIHMPRWACRLLVRVTDVRTAMVAEISEEDTEAEGMFDTTGLHIMHCCPGASESCGCGNKSPQEYYAELWDSVYAKTGYRWSANPWVWVVTFEQIEGSEGWHGCSMGP